MFYVFCGREKISGPHATRKNAEADKESRKGESRYSSMFVVEASSDKESFRAADAHLDGIQREHLFRNM
jgi:hypothetical protein